MKCFKNSLNLLIFLLYSVISAESNYNNVLQLRIVNGTDAVAGEFPFMVSLRLIFIKKNDVYHLHICGGSLLNRLWVLTAGDCVSHLKPTQLSIQYDSVELNPNGTNNHVAYVSHIFTHEGYNASNLFIHDIALLRLVSTIQYPSPDNFPGVRLPQLSYAMANEMPATLIGWGLNGTGGVIQKHLQKVNLTIFDAQHCSNIHNITLHETTLCAGVTDGYKGQCTGDSGGPLLINNTLIGIVSWSRKPCVHPPLPGVLTKVSSYLQWILKTILNYEDVNEY